MASAHQTIRDSAFIQTTRFVLANKREFNHPRQLDDTVRRHITDAVGNNINNTVECRITYPAQTEFNVAAQYSTVVANTALWSPI